LVAKEIQKSLGIPRDFCGYAETWEEAEVGGNKKAHSVE
jgi:hypothetical protein